MESGEAADAEQISEEHGREKDASLDDNPAGVVKQEAHYLFTEISKKRKSLAIEYIWHWNRLLVASERVRN